MKNYEDGPRFLRFVLTPPLYLFIALPPRRLLLLLPCPLPFLLRRCRLLPLLVLPHSLNALVFVLLVLSYTVENRKA